MCGVLVCVAAALCVWVSLCTLLFDFRERQWVAVLLCDCALLCSCVPVCGTALHWTVAAAVSGSSRIAAVAMRRSLRSGIHLLFAVAVLLLML